MTRHTAAVAGPPAASMRRRAILRAAVCGIALSSSPRLSAQARIARIGFLACEASSTRVHESFRLGMRELGQVEDRQFTILWQFAGGDYARLPVLAGNLVAGGVDVIVAATTLGVQAAKRATSTIPIVMVAVPDPIGEGFAVSLSRPGGNVTGLSNIVTEVSAKHLELLHTAVPRLARVAVLINPLNPSDALVLEQIHGIAYTRGLKVTPVEASSAAQIDAAFAEIAKARAEALIVATDAFFDVRAAQIVGLALKSRMPTMSSSREMTEAGGLMSYGEDLAQHYRRAAAYVDRILKGASPASLPIEQPTVLEFVVNRKTAAAIGIALPAPLIVRADRVIE